MKLNCHQRDAGRTAIARRLCLWSLTLAAGLLGPAAAAENSNEQPAGNEPLWEIGGGMGAVVFPNYRGSREHNVLAAPLPLIIYRGDVFKVSRDGARVKLIDHPRFGIDIDSGISPAFDSDEDELRRDMPELHPAIEVGPRLSWLFSDPSQRHRRSLRFNLPIYGVAATDLSEFETIGALIHPHLSWKSRRLVPGRDRVWSYSLTAGALWATDAYHDYYYSVAPRFATAARPAFDADGGYSGFRATGGLYHRRGRLRVGVYASFDYLRGAVFEDSPLVATTESYVAGLYVAWTFWESESRAPSGDIE